MYCVHISSSHNTFCTFTSSELHLGMNGKREPILKVVKETEDQSNL